MFVLLFFIVLVIALSWWFFFDVEKLDGHPQKQANSERRAGDDFYPPE